MDVKFFWVDVFAEVALAGNPLALVPDADHLSPATMRAIAREFNQSETTFLVAPSSAGADVRLRSFTPGGVEVLGAGHNAMGAWIWLAQSGQLDPERTRFAQQIGEDVLPVVLTTQSGSERVLVSMDQSPPVFLQRLSEVSAPADSLGLGAEAFDDTAVAEVVSTGAAHLLVPVRTRAAVDQAAPDSARLLVVLDACGAEGCYLYTLEKEGDVGSATAYARFFNPTVGIAEDPATGTAAGPLAAVLVRDGVAAQGATISIEQGRALGRPSRLELTVDGTLVRLSGTGVVAAEGTLHL